MDTNTFARWYSGAPMIRFIAKVGVFVWLIVLLGVAPNVAQNAGVSLTETTLTWQTVAYTLGDDLSIDPRSVDLNDVVEQTFTGYVLENDTIQATIVPEYGGRIISLIDKTTGHEQLYQNPLGLPYGIGDGNFYYDWLMVYGGIFPTFPGPEHGKSWFLPWTFEVMTETDDEIAVKMTFTDDITFTATPGRFDPLPTMLEVEFIVSLKAGHRALDTTITLHNPTEDTVRYEYWTCVTLAPGSQPGDTRAPLNTEIIAPVTEIKMPPWWPDTTAQETPTSSPDVYVFDALRHFENWADMGIAYAYPTMNGANFWGAINQDNGEGLIRIADNTVTPGLKLWTWGAESVDLPEDIYAFNERRPYIELWAGVTPEFFSPAFLPGGETITIQERYAVTTGLTNVTHANEIVVANAYVTAVDEMTLEAISTLPDERMQVVISAGDAILYDDLLSDATITVALPDEVDEVTFTVSDMDGKPVLEGSVDTE